MSTAIRKQHFGAHVKRLRESHGFTQLDIASALGYTTSQFISNWERGVSMPPLTALPVLAKAFMVTSRHLVELLYTCKSRELDDDRRRALRLVGKK